MVSQKGGEKGCLCLNLKHPRLFFQKHSDSAPIFFSLCRHIVHTIREIFVISQASFVLFRIRTHVALPADKISLWVNSIIGHTTCDVVAIWHPPSMETGPPCDAPTAMAASLDLFHVYSPFHP